MQHGAVEIGWPWAGHNPGNDILERDLDSRKCWFNTKSTSEIDLVNVNHVFHV